MNTVTPTATGGAVTSWTVSPSLPAGLSFDTASGAISGTPTTVTPSTNYTVTASNAGGSSSVTVTLQVNDIAPTSVVYTPNTLSLTKDAAMTTVTPTASGGAVTNWSIAPSLPSGLSFDNATGAVSGTPAVLSPSTPLHGDGIQLRWQRYGDAHDRGDRCGTVCHHVHPKNAHDGEGNRHHTGYTDSERWSSCVWSISPALPAGLSFDTVTGTISGTPTAVSPSGTYTVTATNAGGSGTATLTIEVNDVAPVMDYIPNDLQLTNNTASSDLPLAPTVTGSGTVDAWTISPSLPSGLVFDTATGTISGTPDELLVRTMFTITATNTGGSATAYRQPHRCR